MLLLSSLKAISKGKALLEAMGKDRNVSVFDEDVDEVTEDEAKAAITEEIQATVSFEMLFRENNPRVKIISEYVLEHSTPFLRKALRSTFQQIREASYLNESSPRRHLRMISDLHYGLLDALSEGKVGDVFPSDVARCLQHLSNTIEQTFPGVPNSGQIAVGSIFFLRTLCPTVLVPERLGMRPYETESERSMAKAVVKRLQLLVNLVVRGEEAQTVGGTTVPSREYLNGEEGRLKDIMKILVRPLYSQSPYFVEEHRGSSSPTTSRKKRSHSVQIGRLASKHASDDTAHRKNILSKPKFSKFNLFWTFFREGKHIEGVVIPPGHA